MNDRTTMIQYFSRLERTEIIAGKPAPYRMGTAIGWVLLDLVEDQK